MGLKSFEPMSGSQLSLSHLCTLDGMSMYRAVFRTVEFGLKFDRIEYGGGIC